MPRKTTLTAWTLVRRRSSADRRVLLEAATLLPAVSVGLRTIGWMRVQRFLDRKTSLAIRRSVVDARHLSALVESVARRGPFQYNCLQRSLVLWRVLRRRDLEAELRIGVGKDVGGERQFHAWVEHGDEVLNDVQSVRERFSAFGAARGENEDPS